MRHRFLFFYFLIGLSGCASTEVKYFWENPAIPAHQLEATWAIDKAECDVEAYRAISLPKMHSVSGGAEGLGCGSPFLCGYAAGQRQRQRKQQIQAINSAHSLREEFSKACLFKRGWRRSQLNIQNGGPK